MWITEKLYRTYSDQKWFSTLKRFNSRLNTTVARGFEDYRQGCAKTLKEEIGWTAADDARAQHYHEQGYVAFSTPNTEAAALAMLKRIGDLEASGEAQWSEGGEWPAADVAARFPEVFDILEDELSGFVSAVFRAHYKIWYGKLYRSVNDGAGPSGSQLWHADGGPGTCINLMFCLSGVSARNGAMECLPWPQTLELSRMELGKESLRDPKNKDARKEFYAKTIEARYRDQVFQPEAPPGLVYAFRNNCIHRGGWPEPGEKRYVFVFHVYPARTRAPFDRYRVEGVPKRGSYPKDPAFDE